MLFFAAAARKDIFQKQELSSVQESGQGFFWSVDDWLSFYVEARVQNPWLAKSSYTHKMNDLAQ